MRQSKDYLKSKDVAEMLDVSQATVRSWISKGWLKAFKLSDYTRSYRIERQDLDEFLNATK